jgi:hypothetical protein
MHSLIPLTKEKIQVSRTPSELKTWISNVRSAVYSNKSELKKAIKKQGLYKEFIDEITPLSEFCKERFTDSYHVKPIIGSDNYDAEISHVNGLEKHLIELTMPHDGEREANESKLAKKRGYGTPKLFAPGEEVAEQFIFAIETARKKSSKDYSKCILVFALPISYRFAEVQDQQIFAEDKIISEISTIKFKAKEVWVLCSNCRVVNIQNN